MGLAGPGCSVLARAESQVLRIRPILGTMTFGGQVDDGAGREMLNAFASAGHHELDTAYIYRGGKTEEMLGRLLDPPMRASWSFATKAHPIKDEGLSPRSVRHQLLTSLDRLNTDHAELFYLHSPDLSTPIRETLQACWELHQSGKFEEFGLSNYAAWQVAEIAELCERQGWIKPSVYQGMYNPLTRDVEPELFPCLRNYGIRFYAYNPLAGGMMTSKYAAIGGDYGSGRFALHENYRERYWNRKYFEAIALITDVCKSCDTAPTSAALRWLIHHSELSAEAGDAVILGASRISQLEENIEACSAGPLPSEVVSVIDLGWEMTRPSCMKYFRP